MSNIFQIAYKHIIFIKISSFLYILKICIFVFVILSCLTLMIKLIVLFNILIYALSKVHIYITKLCDLNWDSVFVINYKNILDALIPLYIKYTTLGILDKFIVNVGG